LLTLTLLILTSVIQTHYWRRKCKPITPPFPTIIKCTKSTVIVGSESYIDCKNCISGSDVNNVDPKKKLEYKLNTEKIFTTGGWTFGATVTPYEPTVGSNILGLSYDSSSHSYSFTKTTTTKYEIVISFQTKDCYTPFLFKCTTFDKLKDLIFTKLGMGTGLESQPIVHITYFYRQCGTTIVDCHNGSATINGISYLDCDNCFFGQAYNDVDTTKTLQYRVNTLKIFNSDGWIMGGNVSTTGTNPTNPLGLTYNSSTGFSFTQTTNIKYEIIIAIQVKECYTSYYFGCLDFSQVNNLIFNPLGLADGTAGQNVTNIVYMYKECGYTPVPCSKGTVTIGGITYINCSGCFPGSDISTDTTVNLENKLNVGLIYGTGGWLYGATVSPSSTSGTNPLMLSYSSNKYDFNLISIVKYEVVISLQIDNCYTTYLFPCLTFDSLKNFIYNTLGIDKGTGQPIVHITYFYRQCPSPGCTISNPTLPKVSGQEDCTLFGSITTSLGSAQACWGAYPGNLDDDKCTVDNNKGEVCLYRVLNTTPSVCDINWCFVEKLEASGSSNVGTFWTITVISGTDTRKGTFTINSSKVQGPFIITLKAANFYSAYFIGNVYTGSWISTDHGLSHASLWAPCPKVGLSQFLSPVSSIPIKGTANQEMAVPLSELSNTESGSTIIPLTSFLQAP